MTVPGRWPVVGETRLASLSRMQIELGKENALCRYTVRFRISLFRAHNIFRPPWTYSTIPLRCIGHRTRMRHILRQP